MRMRKPTPYRSSRRQIREAEKNRRSFLEQQHDQQEDRPVESAAMSSRQASAGSKKYLSTCTGRTLALPLQRNGLERGSRSYGRCRDANWPQNLRLEERCTCGSTSMKSARSSQHSVVGAEGVEFSAHGAQNDKGFAIEFQGQHFFAKVTAKKARPVPSSPGRSFRRTRCLCRSCSSPSSRKASR